MIFQFLCLTRIHFRVGSSDGWHPSFSLSPPALRQSLAWGPRGSSRQKSAGALRHSYQICLCLSVPPQRSLRCDDTNHVFLCSQCRYSRSLTLSANLSPANWGVFGRLSRTLASGASFSRFAVLAHHSRLGIGAAISHGRDH